MESKKQHIMRAAIRCFSEQGYAGTSIQDIANAVEMSKGSLYFYFKSKSDLLYSILHDYLAKLTLELEQLYQDTTLSPRERFLNHIETMYHHYEQDRAFFAMLIKERFEQYDDIHKLVTKSNRHNAFMIHELMCELYGEHIRRYALDLTTMFQAIFQSYLAFVVFENRTFVPSKLAGFLLEQLDGLASNMVNCMSESMLGEDILQSWSEVAHEAQQAQLAISHQIQQLRGCIKLQATPDEDKEMQAAVDVVVNELHKPSPDQLVVRGMVALLKAMAKGNASIMAELTKLEAILVM